MTSIRRSVLRVPDVGHRGVNTCANDPSRVLVRSPCSLRRPSRFSRQRPRRPDQASAVPAASPTASTAKTMTAAECTAERLGATVAPSAIGEPVRSVTLSAPSWVEATNGVPAHCRVNGSMAPDRHRQHRQTDQLQRRAAGIVVAPRGAAGRRRHERHRPQSDRRRTGRAGPVAARSRLRDLRK